MAAWPAVSGLPWPMLLDSAGGAAGGRYDLLVADPVWTLVTRGRVTELCGRGGMRRLSREDPLALLREALGARRDGPEPFAGGAVGYFAYDLGRRFEPFPARALRPSPMPEMAVGIYEWAVVTDHRDGTSFMLVHPGAPQSWRRVAEALTGGVPPAPQPVPLRARGPVFASLERPAYEHAFRRVARYIREGDCYQINLAVGYDVPVSGAVAPAYAWLRRRSPAPYGALLELPWGAVLCNSPEGFLRVREGVVQSRPVKGTRPRRPDPAADRAEAEALRASPKDRAENVMIVDLLRNDLGRNCRPGSIRVPELWRVEHYANVHHLVSTVTGRLAPGRDALDLLRGCFPGGSITGAPKRRAMEIIEELEGTRRGPYAGAVGYIGYDGAMDTCITIRTIVMQGRRCYLQAGGGIVADSDPTAEYHESLNKARALAVAVEVAERGL